MSIFHYYYCNYYHCHYYQGDYKSGWQLEKEWDKEQEKKKKILEERLAKFMNHTNTNDITDGGDVSITDTTDMEAILNNIKQVEKLAKDVIVDDDGENYEIEKLDGMNADDNLPFACFICRESFKNPIMTLCQHYFCSDCIFTSNKNLPLSHMQ